MTQSKVSAEWKQNYETFYEDVDSTWRAICAVDKVDNIVRLCASRPHSTVMEVGAGDGAVLSTLADRSFGDRLLGLEIAQSAVDAVAAREDARFSVALYDGYVIPYEDQSIDLIVLSHVVEHLEHPRMLIAEAARVARTVFIEVPLEDTVRLKWNYTPNHVGHINFYSPQSIRNLIQTCGLEVHAQAVTLPSSAAHQHYGGRKGALAHVVKRGLKAVAPRLAPRVLGYHCALVCSKA